jgi:hypothetical protein
MILSMCDSGATFYRFADALSSDLVGYVSHQHPGLFALPPQFALLFLVRPAKVTGSVASPTFARIARRTYMLTLSNSA